MKEGLQSANKYMMEKAMAPHSSTLAWKIPWTEEPDGLPSMGSHRVRQDWNDLAAAALAQASVHEIQHAAQRWLRILSPFSLVPESCQERKLVLQLPELGWNHLGEGDAFLYFVLELTLIYKSLRKERMYSSKELQAYQVVLDLQAPIPSVMRIHHLV